METNLIGPDESENFRTAIHEVGHYLACSHFKIFSDPVVIPKDERHPASNGLNVVGECRMSKRGTPFQCSVIGWCGILAEHIASVHPSLSVGFPLQKSTMKDFFNVVMANLDKLSHSDQTMICGYQPSYWLPFKSAYRILRRNKSKLIRLASMKSKPVSANQVTMQNQQSQPTTSIGHRAAMLEKFLSQMSVDNPDRRRFEEILSFLRRGEEPPASLFETTAQAQTA